MSPSLQRTYHLLARHKTWTLIGCALFMVSCIALFLTRPIQADISAMIPDGENGKLARDLEFLSQSSLAGMLFITVYGDDETTPTSLLKNANQLKQQLDPTHFSFINLDSVRPLKAAKFLLNNAPNLLRDEDLGRLKSHLEPEHIGQKLSQAYRQLSSPMGMIMKPLIRQDPIGMREILLPKLKALNAFSHGTMIDGLLVSNAGTSVLLMARTNLSMTDAEDAQKLLDLFGDGSSFLPESVHAEMVSPHAHTVANATTIQHDLLIISALSAMALLAIFWFFFRSRNALVIILAPAIAMCAAMGGLALYSYTISAIVIGFGAVLIGIAIDFSMHVYFALSQADDRAKALGKLSRPIISCTLTSCAAFGALMLSDIPGIRQLAIFSISGLIAASLFSLFILPLLCSKNNSPALPATKTKYRHPRLALASLGIILLIGGFGATTANLQPDMRAIDAIPEAVRAIENHFSHTWGGMRDRGILFIQDDDIAKAMRHNEQAYKAIRKELEDVAVASLAPILPSLETQQRNQIAWLSLWSDSNKKEVLSAIHTQGSKLGFSQNAFSPFVKLIDSRPSPIMPEALDSASLEIIRRLFMPLMPSGIPTFATFLPDTDQVRAFFSQARERDLNARYVSNGTFKATLESSMRSDIITFIVASGLAVTLLILLLFRNIRQVALALLPGTIGMVVVLGALGYSGTPLNLFHIAALPLIIGLGTDYGIFMVNMESQKSPHTIRAVTASGFTTLAGFGILALANHPSLHSMGITVLLGVGASLACALFIMPHLTRRAS